MSWVLVVANAVWVAWAFVLWFGLIGQIVCKIQSVGWIETAWRACAWAHQELWLFVPPGILFGTVRDWHSPTPWWIVFDAWALYGWWTFRNWPDENRWTKRGRKARSAVARLGARLVEVPAGSGS